MNVSEIPNTPEMIVMGVGIIFGIGLLLLIGYMLYKILG
jgi:hypothetical protein